MMRKILIKAVPFFLIIASALPLQAAEPDPLQRYGIIIGVNEGGPTRTTLKFAASDAQAFAAVMQEMGGLTVTHRILLLNPGLEDITRAFTDMRQRLAHEKELYRRQEFILYYSGHSDEEGLMIGTERLPYKDLRALVADIPSDVRIAVIDSCASGVFIRTKGGVQKPPFMVDAAADMKGYAFLTSSSETEAAQESDRIEGSFFTHYLVSGLRGAADATRDGVVTLNEAYHFSFNETLTRTEKTQFGPQHPSYDIQLSGTGDLVLTDLRETSAGLVIAEEIEGRIFIRNRRGKLVVELNKQEKNSLEIGLAPGTHSVLVDADNRLRRAKIRLTQGRRSALTAGDLTYVSSERTALRGDDPWPEKADMDEEDAETGELDVWYKPFQVTIFPGSSHGADGDVVVVSSVVLNLTVGEAQRVNGAEFSLIGGMVEEDLLGFQGAGIFNITGGETRYFQGAGVFNIAGGTMKGFQGAGVFNIAEGPVSGVQLSGVFNIAEGDVNGYQGAAVFNIADDKVNGVQTSILNIAGGINGVQVGMLNIAGKVNGVQVGLINIAEENTGLALGLFSYSKNGIHNFELWYETGDCSHLAFKFGTTYFYTILLGGYNLFDGDDMWCYGLGIGAHIPIGKIFIDLDALLTSRSGPSQGLSEYAYLRTLLPQIRVKGGVTIFSSISLFAGVDLQLYHPLFYYQSALTEDFLFEIPVEGMTETCKVVPRFLFGVQIF